MHFHQQTPVTIKFKRSFTQTPLTFGPSDLLQSHAAALTEASSDLNKYHKYKINIRTKCQFEHVLGAGWGPVRGGGRALKRNGMGP